MKDLMISNYISKMSINDVNSFALKNNINLKNHELEIIFQTIKKDWKKILYSNPTPILNDLKTKIDSNEYIKIEKLYFIFKDKFNNI